MDNRFWTPPMRGFLRTSTRFGGTNRHLGMPWVGFVKHPPFLMQQTGGYATPLSQKDKTFTGGSKKGCDANHFKDSYDSYVRDCAGLRPDFSDNFYEGPLAAGKRWAFGETDLLCNGGFTTRGRDGSIFSGKECARGTQFSVNVNAIQEGPIPLSGGQLELGPQVVHYECTPNCTAPEYDIIPSSIVTAPDFGSYLQEQSRDYGYATMSTGEPVPELIARMGIFLHWAADRASHWYMCDADGSGITAFPLDDAGKTFLLYLYMDARASFFVEHGMVHYWEQGVEPTLAPGTYSALVHLYRLLKEFRDANVVRNPSWFRRDGTAPLSEAQVVGTYAKPGLLFNITMIREADKRFFAEVDALKALGLPPMPGFDAPCGDDDVPPPAHGPQSALRQMVEGRLRGSH